MVLAIGLPIVIVAGVVVGTIVSRPDAPPKEKAATVAKGVIDEVEWRVDAVQDVEGDTCAFLYRDGAQLTGGCALTPDDASFGDQTVVFGRADSAATTVRVVLSNGTFADISTVVVEGFEGRFYAKVVSGNVDAERIAPQ
ncbi:MAG: hypothetical protein ACT4OV_06655 [Microthrixaceae bacterium]